MTPSTAGKRPPVRAKTDFRCRRCEDGLLRKDVVSVFNGWAHSLGSTTAITGSAVSGHSKHQLGASPALCRRVARIAAIAELMDEADARPCALAICDLAGQASSER